MQKDLTEILINELPKAINLEFDKTPLINTLESFYIPESLKFSEPVSDKSILIKKGLYHEYSIFLNIIRNRNAKMNYLPKLKRAIDLLFGVYSLDKLERSIRGDKEIICALDKCKFPYSLYGKLINLDTASNHDDNLLKITTPFIVIPELKNDGFIKNWIKKNRTCYNPLIGEYDNTWFGE